jgi:hypothetical protein
LILGVLQVERFRLIDNRPQNLRVEAILSCRIRVVVEYILLQLPIKGGIRIIRPADVFKRHWASFK